MFNINNTTHQTLPNIDNHKHPPEGNPNHSCMIEGLWILAVLAIAFIIVKLFAGAV